MARYGQRPENALKRANGKLFNIPGFVFFFVFTVRPNIEKLH